jgi:hypothetical protein
MTLVNGNASLAKQNLYRAGVDQPNVASAQQAKVEQIAYCRNVLNTAPARLERDRVWTSKAASLDPATANTLFTFLAARLAATVGPNGLNCTGLLHTDNPVHLKQRGGIVVNATFTTQLGQVGQGGASQATNNQTNAGA